MAKMTLANLKTFVGTYVDASKQAGAWTNSTDNIYNVLDKIGKQVSIDGVFNDRLPELDGDDLPLGKTIEEYFVDLTLPTEYDNTGADNNAPAYPSVEDVVYSYTLGRKKIKTTEPYDNLERGALTTEGASNMIAKIMERLTNSYTLYKFAQKKQLLGNLITKAEAKGGLSQVVAIPTNTETSDAFIQTVKADVETASFPSENTSLSGALIGAAPEMTLFVKKGVMPAIEVQSIAGAFNKDALALPCKIKVVDDFGSADDKFYAVLCDTRGIKLHNGYHAIRSHENADGDFVNFVDHSENTGFISKYTFVKVYKSAE